MGRCKQYKPISETDACYLAGFFDGEGHIGIHVNRRKNGRRHWYLSVIVTNTCEAVLCWIADSLGGVVRERDLKNPNANRTWDWMAHGPGAAHALRVILPYLRVKRGEAGIALRFQEHVEKYKPLVSNNGRLRLPRDEGRLGEQILREREEMAVDLIAERGKGKQPQGVSPSSIQ